MHISPMLAIYPGLAITAVVYGINAFADALRDVIDPWLRGSRQWLIETGRLARESILVY